MESHKRRWKCILPGFIFALAYIINSFVIARNIERYDTAYECEGKTLRIECQEGELIHLIRANYGRFSITICNEHGNTDWSVNCMSLKSFRVLYSKCNQQQNCSIIASTSQFGDPCPTTLKYLEAHYQCISASTTTTTTSRPSPPWLLTSQSTWNTDFTVPWVSVSKNPVRMSTPSTHGVISQLMSTFTTAPTAVSVSSKSKTTKIWSTDDHERKVKNDFDTNSSRNSPSVPSLLSNTSSLRPPYSVINSTLVFGRNNFRTSTDSSSGPFCPAQYARALMWNATRQGETAVQKCPEGANGLARWHCVTANKISNIPQAVWNRGTPDLSECRSVWLSSLQRRVQTGEIILGISSDLSQVTNNSRELYGGDMLVTTNILRSMATKMAEDVKTYHDPGQREVSVAELLQGVITTGSNLLDEAQSASWGDLSYKEQMVVANSLLISLEENAFLLADTFTYEKTIVHDRRNILMEVRVLEARNLEQFEVFPKDLLKRDKWSKLQNRIELTKSALLSNENTDGFVRLVFMAFDRLEEILQPRTDNSDYPINKFTTTLTKDLNVTQILNSKVISASLGKGKHVQLREPITLYFHHLTYVNVTNPKCVFWNFTISRWSMEGCVTRESNETHTVCECNHLTNFAVLMDVQAVHLDVVHKLALQIITYIGCIISVICLALAIITFQLFRGLKLTGDQIDTEKSGDAFLPLQGTMRVHQWKWSRCEPQKLNFNEVSCYECNLNRQCEHYQLGSISYENKTQKKSKIVI